MNELKNILQLKLLLKCNKSMRSYKEAQFSSSGLQLDK